MVEIRTEFQQGDVLLLILLNLILEKIIREIKIGGDEGIKMNKTSFSLYNPARGRRTKSGRLMWQINRFGKKDGTISQNRGNAKNINISQWGTR